MALFSGRESCLVDYRLGDRNGLAFLAEVTARYPDLPCVFLSDALLIVSVACRCARPSAFTEDEIETIEDLAQVLSEGFTHLDDPGSLKTKNDALARSNTELQEFANIASHDLQEPLRKIRAFGDSFVSMEAASLSERGCDYLQRAAERM